MYESTWKNLAISRQQAQKISWEALWTTVNFFYKPKNPRKPQVQNVPSVIAVLQAIEVVAGELETGQPSAKSGTDNL